MDDCRSVKESEVSFSMSSVSPNFGSLAGGNYVYIYGDFPYAATGDYAAQGNLVAHFDGINNRGLGDKQHDYSATSWKDLKSSFELPRGDAAGQWLSNGFQPLNNDTSFFSATFPIAFPAGNNERTIEVIFRTPANMFPQGQDRQILIYGSPTATGQSVGILYRALQRDACSPENKWVFYALGGNMRNLITCLSSTPSLEMPSTINTVTSTYHTSIADERTNSYINNTQAMIVERQGTSLDTQQGRLKIGGNMSHSTFLSVRLYDRVLEPEEIELNAGLDQIRYLTPPAVTIGGAACEEVVVLSPHFLMCKVPEGSSEGLQDVEVNGVTYSGAYRYVHSTNDFYVSKISPIIGSAGDPLMLEGNRLDEISEIRVDGKVCTPSGTATSTEYECIIPENLPGAGEVDITVKLNDDTVYRFARVFEYLP
jgi:hypothetical protein